MLSGVELWLCSLDQEPVTPSLVSAVSVPVFQREQPDIALVAELDWVFAKCDLGAVRRPLELVWIAQERLIGKLEAFRAGVAKGVDADLLLSFACAASLLVVGNILPVRRQPCPNWLFGGNDIAEWRSTRHRHGACRGNFRCGGFRRSATAVAATVAVSVAASLVATGAASVGVTASLASASVAAGAASVAAVTSVATTSRIGGGFRRSHRLHGGGSCNRSRRAWRGQHLIL